MDEYESKRKSSTLGEDEAFRPLKRRASKACQSCRLRKVRCDVILNETCCTNCKLDNIECLVATGRKRRTSTNKLLPLPTRSGDEQPLQTAKLCAVPTRPAATYYKGPYLSPISEVAEDGIPVCLTFDCEESKTPAGLNEEAPDLGGQCFQHTPSSASLSATPFVPSPTAALSLPSFIKPLPKHIQPDDLEFLRHKGAFDTFSGELLGDILQAYLSGVHVMMPILKMREFLGAIAENDTQHQISLLVFQAVMFAGTAHLPDDRFAKMGYASIKAARKACFTKVQLLYDFETEQDDVAVLQSLLLMSFVYEKQSRRRHTWYWTGLALSHAQSMGLNRDPTATSLSPESQALHKRLWWGLYIRDRLIGLGLRRPIRIKDDDFEVPALDIGDFDTDPLEVEIPTPTGHIAIRQDSITATLLATICVELSRLCVCVGRILSTQYTVLARGTELTESMMMRPRSFEQRSHNLHVVVRNSGIGTKRLSPNSDPSPTIAARASPRRAAKSTGQFWSWYTGQQSSSSIGPTWCSTSPATPTTCRVKPCLARR